MGFSRRSTKVMTVALTLVGCLVVAACGGSNGSDAEGADEPSLQTVDVAVGATNSFLFLPAQYGIELGIWEELGLDVQNQFVAGGGQITQALASGQVDLAASGGAASLVNAINKGLPAKFISSISSDFSMMVLVVKTDSPIERMADIKGKTIGITSPGSLTDYLVGQIEVTQGWPEGSIERAVVGDLPEQLAALNSGSTQGFVWSAEAGYELAEKQEGKVLFDYGDIVKNNIFESILASEQALTEEEDMVGKYLQGWYETVQYMRDHRDETIAYMAEEFGMLENAAAQTYDAGIESMSVDGTVAEANLQGLAQSLVDQGLADSPPDVSTFWVESFVPVSVG